MEKKFAPGDIVKQKTGTINMVVVEYYKQTKIDVSGVKSPFAGTQKIHSSEVETDQVTCSWTDTNGVRHTGNFHQNELEKI